jgi:arginine deiminase
VSAQPTPIPVLQTQRSSAPAARAIGGDAGVTSEVGPLQRVLLHRPGRELTRLTPDNKDGLLFDEVPWLEGAQEEHDRFAELLREEGVEVVYLLDLLADVLGLRDVRADLVSAAVSESTLGRQLAARLRAALVELPQTELAQTLVAGITFAELPTNSMSLVRELAAPTAFALAPLPNHMFTRDSSAWIGRQAHVGRMAVEARAREALHLKAIYTHHPQFGDRPGPSCDAAALEGGDILVLGPHRVLIGVGARTGLGGAERLAHALLAEDRHAEVALAVMPSARAALHLDTVVTMLDHDAFTIYPPALSMVSTYRLRRRGDVLRAEAEPDLLHTLRRLSGREELRVIETGGDTLARDREQWDDANNVLALRPGTVVGYDRNGATNERLAAAGIRVLTFPGSELGRGRGGARCLSCPLSRRPLSVVD